MLRVNDFRLKESVMSSSDAAVVGCSLLKVATVQSQSPKKALTKFVPTALGEQTQGIEISRTIVYILQFLNINNLNLFIFRS